MPFRDSAQSNFQAMPSSAYDAFSDATNLHHTNLVSSVTLITSSGLLMNLHRIKLVSSGNLIMSSDVAGNFCHIKLVAVTLITSSGVTSLIGKTNLCLISSQAMSSGAQTQAMSSDVQLKSCYLARKLKLCHLVHAFRPCRLACTFKPCCLARTFKPHHLARILKLCHLAHHSCLLTDCRQTFVNLKPHPLDSSTIGAFSILKKLKNLFYINLEEELGDQTQSSLQANFL
jgi:hypothetical protein